MTYAKILTQKSPFGRFVVKVGVALEQGPDELDELIGQHGQEEMPVGTILTRMMNRTQSEFGLQGTEHGLPVGERGVSPPECPELEIRR
jgi:hypothetical protein